MVSRIYHLFIFISVLFIFNVAAYSQNLCSLTVKVIDDDTKDVIRNAIVQLDGPRSETQTADMGSAIFTSVSPGPYSIIVKAEGYQDKTAPLNLDPAKKKDYSGTISLKSLKSAAQANPSLEKKIPPVAVSATLSIKITDADTGKLLKNASVEIVTASQKYKKETSSGTVLFEKLDNGAYTITAGAEGYENKSGKIEIDAKKKSEYSGTFKLLKKKQEIAETVKTEEKIAEAKKDTVDLSVKKEEERKPLINTEEQNQPSVKAQKKSSSSPERQADARLALPVTQENTILNSPLTKAALIAASILSSIIMIVFLFALIIKWPEMAFFPKLLAGLGALGWGVLTFIAITAAIMISFTCRNTVSTDSGDSNNKYAQIKNALS